MDLVAGSGLVTTALASVHAADIAPAMTEALAGRTAEAGLVNVSAEVEMLARGGEFGVRASAS